MIDAALDKITTTLDRLETWLTWDIAWAFVWRALVFLVIAQEAGIIAWCLLS